MVAILPKGYIKYWEKLSKREDSLGGFGEFDPLFKG